MTMVLGNISQILINRTDVLMLGVMVDMKSVGIYGVANRIALLLTFALNAVDAIAAPLLSSRYHAGKIDEFSQLIKKSMLISSLVSLPIFVLIILFPEIILGLFGQEYEAGASILRILAAGHYINAVTGPVGFALLMSGHEKIFSVTMLSISVFNIMMNFILIKLHGVIGAAVATAISVVLVNLIFLYFVRSRCLIKKV
jgi:O-antigen/teichoic acid export membrane protein